MSSLKVDEPPTNTPNVGETAIAFTIALTPVPTSRHTSPSSRSMPVAGLPCVVVNRPPSSSRPCSSSSIVWVGPTGKGLGVTASHAAPFQRAIPSNVSPLTLLMSPAA